MLSIIQIIKKSFIIKITRFIYRNFFYGLMNQTKILKLYKTKTGLYYLPFFATEDSIKYHIIKNKIYQKEIVRYAKKFSKKESVILDVGSNYGQMSILFSKLKKNITVYSFEAQKFIFDILEKNIEINKVKNVKSIHTLVGNKNIYTFIKDTNLFKSFSWGEQNIIIDTKNINLKNKIKMIKIDSIKFKKKISFFKIDVEGMDFEVLKGARKTIKKHKMPIIFEYSKEYEKLYNFNFLKVIRFIKSIDYKIKRINKTNYLLMPNKS